MLKEIKEKYTCLDYLGQPVKKTRNGYLYRAPWREDTHPSLSVTDNGRGWHDLATGEHGSVIDLVMRCLNTTDIRRACEEIMQHESVSFSFLQPVLKENGEKKKEGGFKKFEVVKLQSPGLYTYLYKRKINLQIAKQFLMEAHYTFRSNDDSYLYALAYANDLGGYELRGAPYRGNPIGYKGGTTPKGITTHRLVDGAPVVVVEGFADMLSWATLTGGVKHNYVVLNSIVNAPAAIETLKGMYGRIYLALDNDQAGRETTRRIMAEVPTAKDISFKYAPAKDVNDYLIQIKK